MQSVSRSLTESLIVIAKLLGYCGFNSARNAAQRPLNMYRIDNARA
jgi:hypothetical protein